MIHIHTYIAFNQHDGMTEHRQKDFTAPNFIVTYKIMLIHGYFKLQLMVRHVKDIHFMKV